MRLDINGIWSDELDPPATGMPADPLSFSVRVKVSLSLRKNRGEQIFYFRTCSRDSVLDTSEEHFVANTLVLDHFSWIRIRQMVELVVSTCPRSKKWGDMYPALLPYLAQEQ